MRFKTVGNKVDIGAVVIRNAEASAAIPLGSPVVFKIAATNPGLDVVLPGSEVTMATAGCFGVALGTIANAQYGEAQCFGFCNNIMVITATRSDNSASFSTGSCAAGVLLTVDTARNAWASSGGTQAASAFAPFAILMASWTAAGSASASTDTRTIATIQAKAYLRMM